mgnify:CR=1 FL=1|jgi:hypothetical protein
MQDAHRELKSKTKAEDIELVIHSKFDDSKSYYVSNCDMQKFLIPDLKLTNLISSIRKMLKFHMIKH